MRKAELVALGIVLLSFIVAVYFYPLMPEKIASHWNALGQVDGFMPKFFGLFLMPLISAVMLLLFVLIPRIDPLKENIQQFRKYFDVFIVLIFLFLFYIFLLTIYWNLGSRFDMIQLMMPAFAVLFYYCGILIENSKRNWFIGIRTPWTLSNENVWNKTHKLGGKLFKVSAVISLIGLLFKGNEIFFVLIPVLFTSFYSIIYSYFEFKKETAKK
jgi:uncharacterized membrane protein